MGRRHFRRRGTGPRGAIADAALHAVDAAGVAVQSAAGDAALAVAAEAPTPRPTSSSVFRMLLEAPSPLQRRSRPAMPQKLQLALAREKRTQEQGLVS